MMAALQALAPVSWLLSVRFAEPWVLLALGLLPGLALLMRLTPPAPRRIAFPPLRLLAGVQTAEEEARRLPWWLLLLRLGLLAVMIVALARPGLPQGVTLHGSGPLVLVMDNGWATAGDWSRRVAAAEALLAQARQEGRPALLATTAPDSDAGAVPAPTLAPAATVRGELAGIAPQPWNPDRGRLLDWVATIPRPAHAVWVADGLAGRDAVEDVDLAVALQRLGALTVLADGASPLLLRPPRRTADGFALHLDRPLGGPRQEVSVQARDRNGRVLGGEGLILPADETTVKAHLSLPTEAANRVTALRITPGTGAASLALLDGRWRRQVVGLVAGGVTDEEAQPLLNPLHYLQQALEPSAAPRVLPGIGPEGPPDGISALILADVAPLDAETRAALRRWVARGGILIRFAGPRLAANPDELLPVALRPLDRTLGGALSWETPQALGDFPAASPFGGLAVPPEVTVSRQVLADPGPRIADRIWAQLEDGTPLVTARAEGEGWLVLFHTTADPTWSDLPLSGLFVTLLDRLVQLGEGTAPPGDQPLPPWRALDGFGQQQMPGPAAQPLRPDQADDVSVGPRHPPGYYGSAEARFALNVGAALASPEPLGPWKPGVEERSFTATEQGRSLAGPLWLVVAALFVLDTMVSLALRGLLGRRRTVLGVVGALVLVTGGPESARAAEPLPTAVPPAAVNARLAYVRTGDSARDGTVRAGLAGLTRVLSRRTAVELAAPQGIDPAVDTLPFFPLIYWPVPADARPLSPMVRQRVHHYLDHGGLILFDTARSDGDLMPLRRLLHGVGLPALKVLPEDHVLRRSYYLLDHMPGRHAGAPVWVEEAGTRVNDDVSAVIMGSHDWAAAWAAGARADRQGLAEDAPATQDQLALRFGVNLVMYALTGTYKADQVHLPAILERLER